MIFFASLATMILSITRSCLRPPRIIHHLAKSDNALMVHDACDIFGGDYRPGVFETYRGDTGRNDKKRLQRTLFARFKHIAQSIKPGNIADFMRIGDYRGRTVRYDKIGKLFWSRMTRFDVDMAVYQSGDEESTPPSTVFFAFPLRQERARDMALADQEVRFKPLFIEHIENMCVVIHRSALSLLALAAMSFAASFCPSDPPYDSIRCITSFVIFKAKANIFTSLKDMSCCMLRMCKYCFTYTTNLLHFLLYRTWSCIN